MTIEIKTATDTVRVISKPWWTTHAFVSLDGRTCVARCHGTSLTKRYWADRRDYTSGPNHDGAPVMYMLNITEAEIETIRNHPEYAGLEVDEHCGSIETARPKTNHLNQVMSKESVRRGYEILLNEGH